MASTHFLSLLDSIFLEIFTYLSNEDILYAFVDLNDYHLTNLLTEYGAFQQICLSSQLPLRQYNVLSAGIWRSDLVHSFVCKDIFSDAANYFACCKIFPLLTHLRLLFVRRLSDFLTEFVIAHSSTLTHLSVSSSEQAYNMGDFKDFFNTVLPHLTRLKLLDNNPRNLIPV